MRSLQKLFESTGLKLFERIRCAVRKALEGDLTILSDFFLRTMIRVWLLIRLPFESADSDPLNDPKVQRQFGSGKTRVDVLLFATMIVTRKSKKEFQNSV